MKRVRFKSQHGQADVDVPAVGLNFKHGETISVTDEQAEVLLTNPQFKIAADEAPVKSEPAKSDPPKPATASSKSPTAEG